MAQEEAFDHVLCFMISFPWLSMVFGGNDVCDLFKVMVDIYIYILTIRYDFLNYYY